MSNLVIDIGNTRTKVAVFINNELVYNFPTNQLSESDIQNLKLQYPDIDKVIVSSVQHTNDELLNKFELHFGYLLHLDHLTPLPIQNLYETPNTLGKDRIAAAVGGNHLYPNTNLLIIDAGTAITYDFVNEKNQYLGGFITPGLNMRFKALHHFTKKLPLLSTTTPQNLEGKNTQESIIGGIQYGLEGELYRIIDHFSKNADKISIILTGGDKNYFEKLLKSYKFVSLEITLLGLNIILNFNTIQKQE